MKAITLYQPWASAIALGLKRYETRSWATSYRGPLLIHASKRWTKAGRDFHAHASVALPFLGVEDDDVLDAFAAIPPPGCIVAVVELVECRRTSCPRLSPNGVVLAVEPMGFVRDLSPLERLFGDFSEGRWGWELAGVIPLREPVPCPGSQGLWTPDAALLDRVKYAQETRS